MANQDAEGQAESRASELMIQRIRDNIDDIGVCFLLGLLTWFCIYSYQNWDWDSYRRDHCLLGMESGERDSNGYMICYGF